LERDIHYFANEDFMSTPAKSKLFTPVQIGPFTLSHRVVMAPLTRLRSEQPGDIPGDLMAEMYGQRASGRGLIIAEATTVSILGRGYLGAPGIYSDAQVVGWKKVTDAVHAKGGRIFLQLWHVGRQSHIDMTNGAAPVAPSVVPFEQVVVTGNGWVPVSPHRALEIEEISGIVEEFRKGAERAKAAAFDGVEIHGANGYLLDQFLQDGSNKRTDSYGGSVENRARLLLEVTEAVVSVWGPGRVGVRIAPSGTWASMSDSNPDVTFGYVAEQLNRFDLAYLHVVEPRIVGAEAPVDGKPPVAAAQLREIFKGTILAAGGFEPEEAAEIVDKGSADLVAFGRHFAANPDLPKRIELGLPLNAYDRNTFWGGDQRGYSDYPFYGGRENTAA
jgi:N-ethylmaleimide reductase